MGVNRLAFQLGVTIKLSVCLFWWITSSIFDRHNFITLDVQVFCKLLI